MSLILHSEKTFQEKIDDFDVMLSKLTLQDVEATQEERRQLITENLRFDELCDAIRSLFGNDIRSQDIKPIFRKLTTNPDAKIDWTEIFGYLDTEKVEQELSASVVDENSVITTSLKLIVGDASGDKKTRDSIHSLKYVPCLESILAVSQKGIVTVWNQKLRLQYCLTLEDTSWSTAVEYLQGFRKVAVCTERSIHIFDHRATGKQLAISSIKPFSQSPMCVTWVPYSKTVMDDTIVFGDDQGYLNFARIHIKDLTVRNAIPNEKKAAATSLNSSVEPGKLVEPILRRRFHDDWVLRVRYFPDLKCIASCSANQHSSFVLEPVERIWDGLEVKPISVFKGVNTFDYCQRSNVIITGGVDKIIRVWHPHIWTRPTGKLLGHLFTICDMVVNQKDQHLVSLSTARIFRVWDLFSLTCLQVFTDTDDRPGEKRIYSMDFDFSNERLMTGSSVLEMWPLTRSVQNTMLIPYTHDRQLVQILSNQSLNQLISVCLDPIIKVWDVETGKLQSTITEPHGLAVEVTAMALSPKGFRLATGGANGSLIIWDLGCCQDIKKLSGTSRDDVDWSITGLNYASVSGNRCVIASGWENKIRIFQELESSHELELLKEFNDNFPFLINADEKVNIPPDLPSTIPAVLLDDKISCQDYCHKCHVLVTGTENGMVFVWDIENGCGSTIMDCKLDEQHNNDQLYENKAVHAVKVLFNPSAVSPKRKSSMLSEYRRQSNFEKSKSKLASSKKQSTKKTVTGFSKAGSQNEEHLEDFNETDLNIIEDVDRTSSELSHSGYSPPVVVSAHADGKLRFWKTDNGSLLVTVQPDFHPADDPLTALAVDTNCNHLLVGNSKGYLCLIRLTGFLASQTYEEYPLQLVTWRAHKTCVTTLEYSDTIQSFFSSGHDGSIRVYWGKGGRYVGYFGQSRQFTIPKRELSPGARVPLPPDITERPAVAEQRSFSARQKERATRNMGYPLKFLESRWDPFSRTKFLKEKEEKELKVPRIGDELNKKFFKAVIKPKAYNDHLESSRCGSARQGAVFRSLPVYRVDTPVTMTPPGSLFFDVDTNHADSKKPLKKAISRKKDSTTMRSSALSTVAAINNSSSQSRRSSMQTRHSKKF